MANCTYYSTQEWKDRRWRAVRGWNLEDFAEAAVAEEHQSEIESRLQQYLGPQEEELDELTVGDVWPRTRSDIGITRQDFLEAWDQRDDTLSPPTACPHEAVDGNRCIFHAREVDGEKVQEALLRAIHAEETSRRNLSGATLPALDLRFERLSAPDAHPIVLDYADLEGLNLVNAVVAQGLNLRYARVNGTVDLHNAELQRHLAMEGLQIGGDFIADEVRVAGPFRAHGLSVRGKTRATGSTFEGSVMIEGAELRGEANFFGAIFNNETSFSGSKLGEVEFGLAAFRGTVQFRRVESGGMFFGRTTFKRVVQFENVEIDRIECVEADFRSRTFFSEFTSETVIFAGSTFAEPLTFSDVTAREYLHLGRATLDELNTGQLDTENLSLLDATIRKGQIDVPNEEFRCNLAHATLGEVEIKGDGDQLRSVLFYDTAFEGFDFATEAHREALRAVDWNVHLGTEAHAREEAENEEDGGSFSFETTYLRAKQGALDQGDAEAASEFYVREMRHRRSRLWTVAADSDESWRRRGAAFSQMLWNAVLDGLAVYGERPGRVVALCLGVVVVWTVLYPLTTGIRTNDGELVSYACEGLGALPESLYFSVVSFTTVGYGDVTPAGPWAQFLAGTEAFLGAFLLALLIFVIGRTMRL